MNPLQRKSATKIDETILGFKQIASDIGELPSDKAIQELSECFYDRDKDYRIGFDNEMAAVQRGIVQGMKLMREIAEITQKHV